MNRRKKISRSNSAVSEIMGTVLILGMAVALFSVLYFMVLSEEYDAPQQSPTFVAFIEKNNIVIEHRGGDELGLDNFFNYNIEGEEQPTVIIGDVIDDINSDGKWNLGERLYIEFDYSLDNSTADLFGVDEENNEAIFTGQLDVFPRSDLGVEISIDNKNPRPGKDSINITITVFNYRGDTAASGIKIKFLIPSSLKYTKHTPASYNYDNETGIWDIDEEIPIRGSISMKIEVEVKAIDPVREPTQLAMLLDGSGSISSSDWDIMLNGISLALENGYVPHDESVELTVIQFGGWWVGERSWAQVELGGPIVLSESNYQSIADDIKNINQLGGGTAMSCAFRLAADVLSGDPNNKLIGTDFEGMASINSDWKRQIINLVTDGQPNIVYNDNYRYTGTWPGSNPTEFIIGKDNTEEALQYYESLIPTNSTEGDEIDAEAVGDDTDQDWLRDYIVRPQPGYDNWPPAGPGWVRYVDDYTVFANTISETFRLLFDKIDTTIEITSLDQKDPNSGNNVFSVSILPTD